MFSSRCSWKFCKIHKKTRVLESPFLENCRLDDSNFIEKRREFPVNFGLQGLNDLTGLEEDEINVSRTSPFLSIQNVFFTVPWQENKKMNLLNLTLATAFIFYIAATSWSGYFLMLCSKVVLRLALVHSKYTGNTEITAISIRRWMKYLLLNFPATLCWKHRSLKTILSNLSCSENFREIYRKKSMAFTSASNSKKNPPDRCCFLGSFPKTF